MKNRYEFVHIGTEVILFDSKGNKYPVTVTKEAVIIYVNGDHVKNLKTLIDAEDYERVDKATDLRWYADFSKGTLYVKVCKTIKGERFYTSLHRFIANCEKPYDKDENDEVADHFINHFGLDNRKENLRVTTMSQNSKNKVYKKDSSTTNTETLDQIFFDANYSQIIIYKDKNGRIVFKCKKSGRQTKIDRYTRKQGKITSEGLEMIVRHFICFMGENIDYTIDFKVDGENDYFTISDNTSIISIQVDLIGDKHIEKIKAFILDLSKKEEYETVEEEARKLILV